MKTRPLTWQDLKVDLGMAWDFQTKEKVIWKNRNGECRVYARLNLCSFISHTIWVKDPNLNDPDIELFLINSK